MYGGHGYGWICQVRIRGYTYPDPYAVFSYVRCWPTLAETNVLRVLYNSRFNSALPVPSKNHPTLLAKPQSWGAAPRFGGFPPKFTPGRAGPPSAPPVPKLCKAP